MTLTFCSTVLFLFTKFTTSKKTKLMPVQNQQEDSKECGVCDWKLIIKNTAVQVKGWLVRGGNAMWESLLMKQIVWYKKLNSPSPLSPLIHRWWCACVRWVEITPRCRKRPPTGGSNAALTPTSGKTHNYILTERWFQFYMSSSRTQYTNTFRFIYVASTRKEMCTSRMKVKI